MSFQKVTRILVSAMRLLMLGDASSHDRLSSAIHEMQSISEDEISPDYRSEFVELLSHFEDYLKGTNRSGLISHIPIAILRLYTNIVLNSAGGRIDFGID